MSFGKKKMHAVCDSLAPNVLVCDHRGMEFLVITTKGIHCGKVNTDEQDVERFAVPTVDKLPEHYRAWAKRLYKSATVAQ